MKGKFLITFIVISMLSCLFKIYKIFFKKATTVEVVKTGDAEIDRVMELGKVFSEKQELFYHNNINKFFLLVLIVLILISFFLCIKKYVKSSEVAFLTYVVLNFIHAFYQYRGISKLVSMIKLDEIVGLAKSIAAMKFNFNVFLFIIYSGLLVYSIYKESKQKNINKIVI